MKKRVAYKKLNARKKALLKQISIDTNSKAVKIFNACYGGPMWFTLKGLPNYRFGTDGQVFWGEHEDNIDKFRWGRTSLDSNSYEEFIKTVEYVKENYWRLICKYKGIEAYDEEEAKEKYQAYKLKELIELKKDLDWLRSGQVFLEAPSVVAIGLHQYDGPWKYEVAIAYENEEDFKYIVEKLKWKNFKTETFENSFADSSSWYWEPNDPTFEAIYPDGVVVNIGKNKGNEYAKI